MPIFKTPFSRAYWREALNSFHSSRGMVFAALMVAACIAMSCLPSIPVTPGGRTISLTFVPRAVCALVCGPVGGVVFAAAEDTLSFLVDSGGYPYFPGYMLTTMLGCLTYALFLYRARVTVLRVFLAKLLTNVQNVLLGALWSSILQGKAYLFIMADSAVKNLITLPVYTVILVAVLRALLPILCRMGVIPSQLGEERRMRLL